MGIIGGEGRLIGGRYRLGIRLGRGGMGTVWRATDEILGRQVAVKELHLDEGTTETEARVQRERAMREARTVARIKHPNVIVVHDVVEQDGRPWIVMELVEGPSLADRLQSGGPVAPREAARIGVALLGALHAAHALGVLHRDIKPANVLMEPGSGRVVLTDFGIAQVPGVTTLTDAGGFVGSPEYTAPERMAGRGAGPEADLWSLGVLLCVALSGESPFRRDSLGGVLHAVVYDEIELPEAARPLHAVVHGLLERDTGRRLAAGETERLLRGYLQSGRAPERGTGGHGGHGPGRFQGHGGGATGLAAEAAEAAEATAGTAGTEAGPSEPASGPAGPKGAGGAPGAAGSPGLGGSAGEGSSTRPGESPTRHSSPTPSGFPTPGGSPAPGGPRPGDPAAPRHPGPDAHASPYDGPGGGLPGEQPPNEHPPHEHRPDQHRSDQHPPHEHRPGEDPRTADTPPASPAGPARASAGGGSGRPGRRAGGRGPAAPIRAALDDRALAAAARPHTGRTRTVLLVALAAVLTGGAGAGIAVLLMQGSGTGDGPDGRGRPSRSQQASDAGPTRPTGPGTAKPTAPATSSPSPGATGKVPAGYRLVNDPAGFVLAVPDGFTRSYENERVYYSSQGKRFRIGVQLQKRVPEGPLGAMRTADAEGPVHYPGYRQGQVTETTHNGLRAGRWEFVWDGGAQDGGPRYTYDLSWDEGGKMIDVWISSPVGSRTEAERHFDTALDAFRLPGA
ncbi:serine/threonine-protein kinase [Streptomyces decoyicus]|uniref:serine/threonine-protein kinase n=1 Tax=Streptomyces decoyicus TaxID=249567 RepID=UPI003866C684|nr:serine/threonine protein kinase [Streptomyces decoyicus]